MTLLGIVGWFTIAGYKMGQGSGNQREYAMRGAIYGVLTWVLFALVATLMGY